MGTTESSSKRLDKTERYLNSKYSTELLEKGDVFSHQDRKGKSFITSARSKLTYVEWLLHFSKNLTNAAWKVKTQIRNPSWVSWGTFYLFFPQRFPDSLLITSWRIKFHYLVCYLISFFCGDNKSDSRRKKILYYHFYTNVVKLQNFICCKPHFFHVYFISGCAQLE